MISFISWSINTKQRIIALNNDGVIIRIPIDEYGF